MATVESWKAQGLLAPFGQEKTAAACLARAQWERAQGNTKAAKAYEWSYGMRSPSGHEWRDEGLLAPLDQERTAAHLLARAQWERSNAEKLLSKFRDPSIRKMALEQLQTAEAFEKRAHRSADYRRGGKRSSRRSSRRSPRRR
jgi:hypothetical protein